MPTNVEIKARVQKPELLSERAKELSNEEGVLIVQQDTFFNTPNCRLKLRQLQNRPSQLIFYDRPDAVGPKVSDYHITHTNNPQDLRETLGKALGIKGEVKKERMLYMVGQTRVHVDKVDGLGNFMELEVVLREGQSAEEGERIAHDLMEKLGVQKDDLVQGAYLDMILQEQELLTPPY